ncbi:MAG: PLP-dependent aminotransferase family protein [Desulfobacter sp.]|nr:PLP-dependent aminotransferase family protein [Desulfobacter sp.]WDP86804.1 MAG: PLP-dependent aminotransferase family protein [Desulfobacter sp.]
MKNKNGKFLYSDLADQIQARIESGGFKISEKLPSLRALCQSTGYSMTTVFQAYVELEKRGVVESRDRSGYFIKPRLKRLKDRAQMTREEMVPRKINLDDLIHQLTEDMGDPQILNLGGVMVAPEHLPVKRLHNQLKAIPQDQIPRIIAGYAHPQGVTLLRHQISNLLFPIIPGVKIEDIIITNGCTEALSLSLKAVSKPGSTIIVESPTDPWLRQTIKDSNMFTLEIPANPETGMDLTALEKIIHQEKISACIVNPNCQNPLGFIMPDAHKRKLAELCFQKQIPIIENDVTGDLYFGETRPFPIKKWDHHNNVIYCSSFSKVLAPGLRIGWVIPGRFKQIVKRMKLNRSLISPTLSQTLVANYLKEGTYNRHLRQLRKKIKLQHTLCARALNRYLPLNVRMSSPKGGLCIWIELPQGVEGRKVYYEAIKKGISILPGFLCTSFNTYDRFIRIGYGGVWNDTMDNAIEKIGQIITTIGQEET